MSGATSLVARDRELERALHSLRFSGGVLIAGGNFNATDHNRIFANWLFGTMHLSDPRVAELSPAAKAAYDAANGSGAFAAARRPCDGSPGAWRG